MTLVFLLVVGLSEAECESLILGLKGSSFDFERVALFFEIEDGLLELELVEG